MVCTELPEHGIVAHTVNRELRVYTWFPKYLFRLMMMVTFL